MMSNQWKWGQSSQNAFQLVGGFFGFTPSKATKATDAETSKLLKAAEESDTQVKRTQDYVNALKRTWRNQVKTGAMIHGLVRTGLGLLGQQQQQEATTTKEYAKQITNTRVLSAKTQTQVEKTYLKGAKQIEKAGKQLSLAKEEINDQYQVADEQAIQASQQRRLGYREKAQKRLQSQQRPWRNY
jgi:coenzyme F420-reducing hydrogenase alpha subunit